MFGLNQVLPAIEPHCRDILLGPVAQAPTAACLHDARASRVPVFLARFSLGLPSLLGLDTNGVCIILAPSLFPFPWGIGLVPWSEGGGDTRGLYSRLFLVEKSSGGWRPIMHLSPLNEFVRHTPFRMETSSSVLLAFRKGDFLASLALQLALVVLSSLGFSSTAGFRAFTMGSPLRVESAFFADALDRNEDSF